MTERFVTRGFVGRRAEAGSRSVAERIPPGQYLTTDFPVLSAGPTPRTPLDRWSFTIEGLVREPGHVDLGGVHRAAEPRVGGRHQLRHEVDQARHALARRQRRHAPRGRRARPDGGLRDRLFATAATRRTCRSPTSSTARRSSPGSTTASRWRPSTAGRRAWSSRPATSGRARSGSAACGSRPATSPASGNRSATTTAATSGSKSATAATEDDDATMVKPDRLAARDRHGDPRRDADRSLVHARACPTGPAIGRPARRPAADRRGRLQRRAELLDRVRAGARRRGRHHRRADRGRRGLAVPARHGRRGRPARGARPDRRLLRLGGGARRTAAARRGRLGRRAADGDAPAPAAGRLGRPDAPASSARATRRRSSTARSSTGWPRRATGSRSSTR